MKNLKIARKNAGLTQKELAKLLNIPVTTYANYEQITNSIPPIETLLKISSILNYSTDYLLGRRTSLSETKQQLINIISNLDDDLCSLAEAYIEGLKTTQKQRDMVRARVSQQNNNIEEDID